MTSQTRNDPTVIFVLGLLGMMACMLLSPVAWYMGTAYKAECMALDIEPEGLAKAGYILGIVGTAILALNLLTLLLVIPIFFVAASV